MDKDVDLSIRLAGVKFKSPIVVASSECAANLSQVRNLVDKPIGAIVTKTYTSAPAFRIRVRPYQFPLNKFGKAYSKGGSLFSLAAPHPEDSEAVKKHVSQMADLCKSSDVKLIASFFEDPADVSLWINRAKSFEALGADMLELNFSSPSAAKVFARSFESASHIISEVKKNTSIPVGLKLSPTLEPLETFVVTCKDAGLDFITAHNAPGGIVIDVENEVPFGAPSMGGYVMGRSFLPYSLGRVVRINKASNVPVIGVGGIYEAQDALQYLLGGCPIVGIGSALYFKGARMLDTLSRDIADWMKKKGYISIEEFQGKAFQQIIDPPKLKSEEKFPYAIPPLCPYIPQIDKDSCVLCGECETSCIYNVFTVNQSKKQITIDEDRCWSCGFCVGICPSEAITLRDRNHKDKVIWNNQGLAMPFITGGK
ncbi:MAG: 4Fe-4S binding protein [Desulfobacterales bacterium]|jgi:dihydroorotate dehydrogenase (fumarate)/dihydropyrimidine dehydrogenase (NAD+) subunit PreA